VPEFRDRSEKVIIQPQQSVCNVISILFSTSHRLAFRNEPILIDTCQPCRGLKDIDRQQVTAMPIETGSMLSEVKSHLSFAIIYSMSKIA
jgi:hypothetical protein